MATWAILGFFIFLCMSDSISAVIYPCDRAADCGCSKANANVYKIVGGEDSYPSSWGWAVSLQVPFLGHFCTGTIVSPRHIITAAHCVVDAVVMNFTRVVVGIDRLSESDSGYAHVRPVEKVFPHPNYDSTKVNDIAVLRLAAPFAISINMSTARLCFPKIQPSNREADYPLDSTALIAIGWDTPKSEGSIPDDLHLQQVTVQAVSRTDPTCAEFVTDRRV